MKPTYYEANRDDCLAKSREYNERLRLETLATAHSHHQRWTSEEDAVLLADDGTPVHERAVRLGRTSRACYERRRRLRAGLAGGNQ